MRPHSPPSRAEIINIRNSEELADVTLSKNDSDNSGTLDFDEFYQMLHATYQKTPQGARKLLSVYERYCDDTVITRRRSRRGENVVAS